MKRYASGIIVASLLMSTAQAAMADNNSDISIKIDGQVQNFDQPPVIVNDRTLVPLRGVFETLGAQVTWNPQDQTVTITKDMKKIVIAIDNPYAVINGVRQKLDEPAHIVNDRTMVPLRFVGVALGADVQWDNANRTVLISTTGFSSGTNGNSTNATNGTNQSQPLTYQKALDLAMENSYPVKAGLASIDRAKEVLDKAADNVEYMPSSGGDLVGTKILTSYAQANINYLSSQKASELTQDSLTYVVKQAYNAVLQAIEKKTLADLALKNATIQLQVAQANYQNGVLGDLDYTQKQNDYNSAKANQEAANKAIDDAYQKLNQLMGLPQDARPQLIDIPQFKPMDQVDLDTKVSQAESQSPVLWQLNQKVDLANLNLKLYTFNDKSNPDPYEAKVIDVNLATYNAADQKDQLDKTVRSLYYGLKQLEDQYNSLQAKLASAQTTLKKTQALYDNGMAVQADLVSAQLGVETIKQQMFDITAQHDNNLLAFNTPWVASGQS